MDPTTLSPPRQAPPADPDDRRERVDAKPTRCPACGHPLPPRVAASPGDDPFLEFVGATLEQLKGLTQ